MRSNKNKIRQYSFLFLFLMVLLIVGINLVISDSSDGTSAGPTPTKVFLPQVPSSQETCLAQGGTWGKWGLGQDEFCQIPAADADKTCTDGSQCTFGKCISESDLGTIGKCSRFQTVYGCYSTLTNGKVDESICVD